jgi:hypothetical protein
MTTFEWGVCLFILPFLIPMLYETIRERGFKQGYEARDAEIEYDREAWHDNYYER